MVDRQVRMVMMMRMVVICDGNDNGNDGNYGGGVSGGDDGVDNGGQTDDDGGGM